MSTSVDNAKAEFMRAKDRLARAFASTPDDRVAWSPAPTARSPIQLVAHAGFSNIGMIDWLEGKPFGFTDMAALDAACLAEEADVTTREQASALLESSSQAYCAWLDAMSPEMLASTFEAPFGSFPMVDAITFPADHIRNHAAQLEYLQTIYGDREIR